jgi:hypothetical protein
MDRRYLILRRHEYLDAREHPIHNPIHTGFHDEARAEQCHAAVTARGNFRPHFLDDIYQR